MELSDETNTDTFPGALNGSITSGAFASFVEMKLEARGQRRGLDNFRSKLGLAYPASTTTTYVRVATHEEPQRTHERLGKKETGH